MLKKQGTHPKTEGTEESMVSGKKVIQPKCALRSHMDGVRGAFFCGNIPILATVSEVFD